MPNAAGEMPPRLACVMAPTGRTVAAGPGVTQLKWIENPKRAIRADRPPTAKPSRAP
jgi:hypothetical protein